MQNLAEIVKSSLHGRLDIALIDKITPHIVKGLEKTGAIVPPCKVGQILYIIEAGVINEAKVKEYKYCSNSNNGVHWHIIFEELFAMSEAHIGKDVFYTREEAQAKLKEGGER